MPPVWGEERTTPTAFGQTTCTHEKRRELGEGLKKALKL
jgi:hypothetical protein